MNVYAYSLKGLDGKMVSLSKYQGKVLLIVNTATHCGFTPTYKSLEEIYEKYQPLGLEILDLPCNQFGEQAPEESEKINEICNLRYHTTFPRFSKIDVNGPTQDPLYKYLEDSLPFKGFDFHRLTPILKSVNKKLDKDYASKPTVKWNFTKFLVDQNGNPVERFEPTASQKKIEKALSVLLGEAKATPKKEEMKMETPEIKELSLATLNGCPHCSRAKLLLSKFGITYKEISHDDPEGEKILTALGITSVPVLLVPAPKGLEKIQGDEKIETWIRSHSNQ